MFLTLSLASCHYGFVSQSTMEIPFQHVNLTSLTHHLFHCFITLPCRKKNVSFLNALLLLSPHLSSFISAMRIYSQALFHTPHNCTSLHILHFLRHQKLNIIIMLKTPFLSPAYLKISTRLLMFRYIHLKCKTKY